MTKHSQCIAKGNELTLQECIQIFKNVDATDRQMKACRKDKEDTTPTATEVHKLHHNGTYRHNNYNRGNAQKVQYSTHRNTQNSTSKQKSMCYKCGEHAWPHPRCIDSPAFDHICEKCNKKGHRPSVCKSGQTAVKCI